VINEALPLLVSQNDGLISADYSVKNQEKGNAVSLGIQLMN
jgi:hypothetical protein